MWQSMNHLTQKGNVFYTIGAAIDDADMIYVCAAWQIKEDFNNHCVSADIGKKIRAGYRQKQKDGLVITPPFGYWKDRNTNQVLVQPEAAETVQLIYALYLQGCGQKEIARRLNSLGRKTPAQIMTERLGYDSQKPHKTRDGQFLWTYASVKNILMEEAYTGVLNNHRREYNNGKVKRIDETDWYRHEGFFL